MKNKYKYQSKFLIPIAYFRLKLLAFESPLQLVHVICNFLVDFRLLSHVLCTRKEWRQEFLLAKFFPVEILEKLVVFQLCKFFNRSQLRLFQHELLHQLFSSFVFIILREFQLSLYDFFVNVDWVIQVLPIRKFSTHHFKQNDSQGPNINRETVAFSFYDLWSHIMWSSYNGKCSIMMFTANYFCCSHIN